MTTLREAAKMALEALEWHLKRGAWGADIEGVTEALRAALAEPEQEPTHIPESWATHGGLWIEALYRNKENT